MLSWIRANPTSVRLVVVKQERSPARLVTRLQRKSTTLLADEERATSRSSPGQKLREARGQAVKVDDLHTVDPCELLLCFDAATDGAITLNDFVPLSVARALEKLLQVRESSPRRCACFHHVPTVWRQLMGYGSFSMRPSPFCAFVTVLLSVPGQKVGA